MRTRVGYTGGTQAAPTYSDLGDHSEAIQIEFDPQRISYADLLGAFFSDHNACGPAWSRQYRSAIFVHDTEQREAAEAAIVSEAKERGQLVVTSVEPAGTFTLAEGYHQKYRLRRAKNIAREYEAIFPDLEDFVDSPAVTRVNAYLGGYLGYEQLEKELDALGLSAAAARDLQERVGR